MKPLPALFKSSLVIAVSLIVLVCASSLLAAERPAPHSGPSLDSKTYLPFLFDNYPLLRIDDFLASCPTAAELASVDAALSLQFEDDPSGPTLVCTAAAGSRNLTQLQKNAYNLVLLMRELEFDQPLPWTSKQLYQWFIDAVDGIRFRANIPYSFCCEPHKVINIRVADDFGGSFSTRWGDFVGTSGTNGGLYVFMGLLIHEARHGEGNYPHVCGNGTKDNTISEMGAWGVHHHFFNWVAYHSDPCFVAPGDYYDAFYLENAAERAHNMLLPPDGVFCQEAVPVTPPPPVPVCPLQTASKGLTGSVTFQGSPIAGITLHVMRNNNGALEWVTEIQTGQDGVFSYTEASTLLPGQRYYLAFYNSYNGNDPDFLNTWITRGVDRYEAGTQVYMGDFDIADINVLAPPSGATVNLPVTLRWELRTPLPQTEGHKIRIVGVGKTPYFSGELGRVDSLTLVEGDLADDQFVGDNSYWAVGIYRDDGSWGETALQSVFFRR